MPGAADEHFPFLTTTQADRIRTETRDAFARHGLPTTIFPTHLESGPNINVPLETLARQCANADESEWAELIDRHVAAIVPTAAGQVRAIDDDLHDHAYLRLMSTDFLVVPEIFQYARPVAEGLIEVIAVDQPETVRFLTDDDVEAVGLASLREIARTNLIRFQVDDYTISDIEGAAIHLVAGSSNFHASKALVLPSLLKQNTDIELPPDGLIVGVPSRHHLMIHPIVDGTVRKALDTLSTLVCQFYQEMPGAVSPMLYWWNNGEMTSVNEYDEQTGTVTPTLPDDFTDVLDRLGESANERPGLMRRLFRRGH